MFKINNGKVFKKKFCINCKKDESNSLSLSVSELKVKHTSFDSTKKSNEGSVINKGSKESKNLYQICLRYCFLKIQIC